ncbi:hypothetical protein [Nocardioides panacisoli]|uniref:DUF3558 domain-containing protein n=1 Tax=Nocardioides panacisoli TaxID=627624 RepID=A0ABP7HTZ2_9ACTN
MRSRSLALSVTALALLLPLSACGGDDKSDDGTSSGDSSGQIDSGTGDVAGPKTPDTRSPDCPFSDQQLSEALDLALKATKGQECSFEQPKKSGRISVTLDAAADNKSYDAESKTYQKMDNFQELDDVGGQAYVAWTDDELNIAVGYLDNAGAYRYQVSAITPDSAGVDDAVALAEQLIDLTVSSRKG